MTHTKDEALDLALEALEMVVVDVKTTPTAYEAHRRAITAIKQALALDKMAENARELGLDYEPAKYSDIVSDGGMDPRNQFDVPPAQPAPVQEPVGEVNRYGLDSRGRKWHGIHWYNANLDVPHGTKLYTAPPAAQPALVQPIGYEKYVAIREGHRNACEEAYFGARPDLPRTPAMLKLLRDGFDRGYDITEKGQP